MKALFDSFDWCGWSKSGDENSHAIVKGTNQTVCGVELFMKTSLVYDSVAACPECRRIIWREHEAEVEQNRSRIK